MTKKTYQKKAISPVIATVLLIAMVVVIALIIFLWFRSINEDVITKFDGENIKLVCGKVGFTGSYSNGVLYISNTGNVPIYGMDVEISGGQSHRTEDIKDISDWPGTGINQGRTFSSGDISSDVGSATGITLTPVLIGMSDKGKQSYLCEQQGFEIII